MWQGWIKLGLPHEAFWDVTQREYVLITTARVEAKNAEFDALRVLNQEMAKLTAFAYHEPNKMPDFTKKTDQRESEMGEREAKIRLSSAFISMHANSKKGL